MMHAVLSLGVANEAARFHHPHRRRDRHVACSCARAAKPEAVADRDSSRHSALCGYYSAVRSIPRWAKGARLCRRQQYRHRVAVGLVESLARPGGNITGVTSLAADLSAKRLDVLKEFLPQLQRVAVIWEPNSAAGRDSMQETEMAARALRIDVEGFGVNRVDDFAGVFQSIATGRFDALDVLAGPIVTGNRARILAFSSQARIPDLYQERPFVEAGGLLSYGPNFERLFHRMAYYVDRILKGAKPADLPVERPTKFELFINLRTAKALGLTIPAGVLSIADEVIE